MSEERELVTVMITARDGSEASRLAEFLVQNRLAACVQILPEIESIYHWEGQIQREAEVMILAKTALDLFDALESEVRSLHSYETPEIIALPVKRASHSYANWLLSEIREVRAASAASESE